MAAGAPGTTPRARAVPVLTKPPTLDEFRSQYLQRAEPVVLPAPPAEVAPCRLWTFDGLRARAGASEVSVRRNTACDAYRTGQAYNIEQMTFAEYLDNLGTKKGRESYLAVQNVKRTFPMLEPDVSFAPYVEKIHAGPFLWVARAGHFEYCHFDPDDGFLFVVTGRKTVRLFAPAPLESMYPNPLGSKGRTVQARVDCDAVDREAFPLFGQAPMWEAEVLPGQMLFIPAFFWHQVSSPEQTISLNVFFGDAGKNAFLTKVMRQPQAQGFHHWLLNITEQNRTCESFRRILQRLDESLMNFFHKQWHETPSPEQLEELMRLVLDHVGLDAKPEVDEAERQRQERGTHPPTMKIRGLKWRAS